MALYINGVQSGGEIVNAQGVFIDTDNVITSGNYTSTLSYTATEDCYVCLGLAADANSASTISIDGNLVVSFYPTNTTQNYYILPLKKGQVLTVSGNSWQVNYTVYGIQSGSNSGIIDYSTTEQKTGQKWADGKPIYQKTYIKTIEAYSSGDDGYVIARDLTSVADLIDFEGTIKVATGQHQLQNSFVNVSSFPLLNAYEFGIHLNDQGVLVLWTGSSSYGSGMVGNTAMITVRYTKQST